MADDEATPKAGRTRKSSAQLFAEAKFDDQGRRLLPTHGYPKELLSGVMLLQGSNWTTDDVRGACRVLDEWAGWLEVQEAEEAAKRQRGRPRGSRNRKPRDETARLWCLQERETTGEQRPYTLARMAADAGVMGALETAEKRYNAIRRLGGYLKAH
jgi:hypothetical protein